MLTYVCICVLAAIRMGQYTTLCCTLDKCSRTTRFAAEIAALHSCVRAAVCVCVCGKGWVMVISFNLIFRDGLR